MTYHVGTGRSPYVVCDACGLSVNCMKKDGWPKAWMHKETRPPGWLRVENKNADERPRHYCKACRGKVAT